LALLGAAAAAHADTVAVTYSTYNASFSPTAGSTLTDGDKVTANTTGTSTADASITVSAAAGTSATLSFHGDNNSAGLTGSKGNIFGIFTLQSTDSTGTILQDFNGVSFTMTVNQSLPGNGSGSTLATVTGTVNTVASGALQAPEIVITFSNPTVLVNSTGNPSIKYTIDSQSLNTPTNEVLIENSIATNPTTAYMLGDISGVPLPKTASAGLGLIGALGLLQGANFLRKRRTA
jgi:hypothetical protein